MKIFPAIDIIDKSVVRLVQGDYGAKTVYAESPVEQAKVFEGSGAKYFHVVDLDAAKNPEKSNSDVIIDIAKNTSLFIEVGGGIRSLDKIENYLSNGVRRVILGTAALRDRAFLLEAVRLYGECVSVGVDAKDGRVAVSGWLETSDTDSLDFCRQMLDCGVKHVIYTDISKDGKLAGTNLEIYRELSKIEGLDVTASGGVSSLDDVRSLKQMNLYGCIIGKALYENRISLEDALSAGGDGDAC